MNNYISVLKKYTTFTGCAARKEYWMFVLFNIIVSIVIGIIDMILGTTRDNGMGILGIIYSLAVLLPSLAVAARRLHDTGRNGWWLLIGLIPFIGAIVLLVFFILDSQKGDNEYGPNPKGIAAEPQPVQ